MNFWSFSLFYSLLFFTNFPSHNCRIAVTNKMVVASGASVAWRTVNLEPNNPLGQACAIFQQNKVSF